MAASSPERRGPPRVALVALGCRVARSDVDALASALGGAFALAEPGERADYVVVSTCTVTADADAAARQAIRRAAREQPGARIVVSGCYAELRPGDLRALPGVAAVVGARSEVGVAEVLRRMEEARWGEGEGQGRASEEGPEVSLPPRERGEGRVPFPHGHTRAFLKIQDGCDARCAYCVVPFARGAARSLPFESALDAIAALGRATPEVVLAGVHLGGYGRDLSPRRSLAELVLAAGERRLAPRVRLSSVEPHEIPLELFEGAARELLCDHVHLPLQSGSARLLAAMRRPYRPREFARVVERLHRAAPAACVGADVMTGFPGESGEDHRATRALIESLPIDYLHVFPFSPRRGTAAASMPGQVPPRLARERAEELAALSRRRWAAFCSAQRGRVLEVAVERVLGGVARGTARNYADVRWPAAGERRGDLVRVRVASDDGEACVGERLP